MTATTTRRHHHQPQRNHQRPSPPPTVAATNPNPNPNSPNFHSFPLFPQYRYRCRSAVSIGLPGFWQSGCSTVSRARPAGTRTGHRTSSARTAHPFQYRTVGPGSLSASNIIYSSPVVALSPNPSLVPAAGVAVIAKITKEDRIALLQLGYMKIPNAIPDYMKKCRFLPKLNECPNVRNSTDKKKFSSLKTSVLILFEEDEDAVLIPFDGL